MVKNNFNINAICIFELMKKTLKIWLLTFIVITCFSNVSVFANNNFGNIYNKALRDTVKTIFNNNNNNYKHFKYYNQLKKLYQKNNFEPFWNNQNTIEQAISLLQNSKNHGLTPSHYAVPQIIATYTDIIEGINSSFNNYLKLELQLSTSVIEYTNNLLYGRLNPSKYHYSWNYNQQQTAPNDSVLLNLILLNKIKNADTIFEPHTTEYQALKKLLQFYTNLQNTNKAPAPVYCPGNGLQIGDTGKHVVELKKRLLQLGYFFSDSLTPVFDSTLLAAVKKFQATHSLFPDGVAGKNTYNFLAWPVTKYINIIKANLERNRWFVPDTINPAIYINLAAFQATFKKHDTTYFFDKIIIGKPDNATPVFQSIIDILVFNPCWTIPNSIATKKILPKLKTDTSYLSRNNMFLALNGVEQNVSGIDFSQYNESNFPYKIFQYAGTYNALGNVKFLFNNPYNIYMHDTPGKNLFYPKIRAFSHGCIRLNNPLKLASIILQMQPNSYKTIETYLNHGYPVKVNLKQTIPVYMQYITVKAANNAFFYHDVYNLDNQIIIDLQK